MNEHGGYLLSTGYRHPLSYLSFRDLEFTQIPVKRYSTRGVEFISYIPVGMPKIPSKFLDCVCYLYGNEEDARAGTEFGGTGFVFAFPSEMFPKDRVFHYVVTNQHVVFADGEPNPVIRINTKDGGIDVIPFTTNDWGCIPEYDIAVAPMPIKKDVHKIAQVPLSMFVTEEKFIEAELSPGEDVFMVGRFINHDGGASNKPAVRMGNISILPTPIKQHATGEVTDCYCIDMHSRTGYSGSPVFVFRTPGFDLGQIHKEGEEPKVLIATVNYLGLLGIHFQQFPDLLEMIEDEDSSQEEFQKKILKEGKYIKGMSGMTCVLPAWKILEVVNLPRFKELRRQLDLMWVEKLKKEGVAPPVAENGQT